MNDRRHWNNVPAPRELRRRQTRSEQLAWAVLRGRGLERLKFKRQRAIGPFVLDFYCAELRLALEIDGSIHRMSEQQAYDRSRQDLLAELGIRTIRVRAEDVEADAEGMLRSALAAFIAT